MTPPPPPTGFAAQLDDVLMRARRTAFLEAAALLRDLAEGHERMGNSAMGKLNELERAAALRDAARRLADLK